MIHRSSSFSGRAAPTASSAPLRPLRSSPDSLPNAKSPRCRPSPATPVGTAAWKPRASECPASAPPALGPAGTAPRPGWPPLGSPAAAGASSLSVSSLADLPGPAAARSSKLPASCPLSAVQPLPAPTAPTASRSVPDPPPTSDRPTPASTVRSAPAFPTAAAPAGPTPRPTFARCFCRFSSGPGSFSSRRFSFLLGKFAPDFNQSGENRPSTFNYGCDILREPGGNESGFLPTRSVNTTTCARILTKPFTTCWESEGGRRLIPMTV